MYLVEAVGLIEALTSIALNVALAYLILASSGDIFKVLGRNGSRALTRIIGLIIAAMAIAIIREGLRGLLGMYGR
jgi:multiple antibiotic resistance protein